VNKLIEVIMDDLSKINNRPLLKLNFTLGIKFHSGGVNESHISDKEVSINRADHKLCFPEFLIIRDMIMSSFTFTNFVDGSVTLNIDLNVSEFLSVDLLKFKFEPLLWDHC